MRIVGEERGKGGGGDDETRLRLAIFSLYFPCTIVEEDGTVM